MKDSNLLGICTPRLAFRIPAPGLDLSILLRITGGHVDSVTRIDTACKAPHAGLPTTGGFEPQPQHGVLHSLLLSPVGERHNGYYVLTLDGLSTERHALLCARTFG